MSMRNPFLWLTMDPNIDYYLVGTLPKAAVVGIQIKSENLIDFNVWYAITGRLYNGGIIVVPQEGMTTKDVIKKVCQDMEINTDDYQQLNALPGGSIASMIDVINGAKDESKNNVQLGYYEKMDIYPLTVVADRYGGTYSKAKFTAWNMKPHDIPEAVFGEDGSCAIYWASNCNPVGRGNTAQEAIDDLERVLNLIRK